MSPHVAIADSPPLRGSREGRTAWEDHLWPVEPIWAEETAFILASGPSLTPAIVESLRGRRVMVINSSYKLAPWADVWFFTDNNVFDDNRAAVEAFSGHVVTLSRIAKREMPLKIKRLRGEWGPEFRNGRDGYLRQGRSSGHTGVSLAIALGATRIVLLGYDMRLVEGREHHHEDYAGRPRDLDIYQREFIPAFKGWNEEAMRYGAQILNATPGSAVSEFPFVDLEQVLACDPS